MEFPMKLRVWRESLDLSLQQVADATGRTRQAVSLWELGKRNPLPTDVSAIVDLFVSALRRVLIPPEASKNAPIERPRARPAKPIAGALP